LTSGKRRISFYRMVESNLQLDLLFGALSDSTRRGILQRVARKEMSIGEVAGHFELTFGAISKHIKVLERARLVTKRRRGKEQVVLIVPKTVKLARRHIERYARLWADRFDELETILREDATS
jgi:DNA-binding transcriptional ArsR family regulator